MGNGELVEACSSDFAAEGLCFMNLLPLWLQLVDLKSNCGSLYSQMGFALIIGVPGAAGSRLLCKGGPGFVSYLLLDFPHCSLPPLDCLVFFEHFYQKGDGREERLLIPNPFNASEGLTDEVVTYCFVWVLDDWFPFCLLT